MKVIVIATLVFVAFILALGVHDEIDWLYHYISRCELRIEALEAKERNGNE